MRRVIGVALLPPGVLAVGYGALQLMSAMQWLWSGAYKNTGYGLLGSILLSFAFFPTPLLILGSGLIYVGVLLIMNRKMGGAIG